LRRCRCTTLRRSARRSKELVDFDLINEREMRFSVGAVQVMSGNSVYFDNFVPDTTIGVEHVMASGALPPGFPPVKIGRTTTGTAVSFPIPRCRTCLTTRRCAKR
jgi:predicted acylesterase/phospholipase RssA